MTEDALESVLALSAQSFRGGRQADCLSGAEAEILSRGWKLIRRRNWEQGVASCHTLQYFIHLSELKMQGASLTSAPQVRLQGVLLGLSNSIHNMKYNISGPDLNKH